MPQERKIILRVRKTAVAIDAEHVKNLRDLLNWLQGDLAARSGLGISTVSNFENYIPIELSNAETIKDTFDKFLGPAVVGKLFRRVGVFQDAKQMALTADGDDGTKRPSALWFDSSSKTLWGTKQPSVPIRVSDLYLHDGRLRRLEVPTGVLESLASANPQLLMGPKVYGYLRDVWSHPKKYRSIVSAYKPLKEWVDAIWAPVPQQSRDVERENLRKFFCAMQDPEPDKRLLPTFTYDDVSCWRVYVQMFPESISLLEFVGRNRAMPTEIRMGISLLSSTLATTGEHSLRAKVLAVHLRDEITTWAVRTYQEYKMSRQFLFAAVEAGELAADRFIDFMHKYRNTNWELRLNREYYDDRSDVTFARGTVNKYEKPHDRDKLTKPIAQYHLHEYGLKEIYLKSLRTRGHP